MNHLRRIRFSKGMTLNAVAEQAGIARTTIMRLEAGGIPTARVAHALAGAYDVDVDVIMSGEPAPEPKAAA